MIESLEWIEGLREKGLIERHVCIGCGKMMFGHKKCRECSSRAPKIKSCIDCGARINAKCKRCSRCLKANEPNKGKHPCADCPILVGRAAKRCVRCDRKRRLPHQRGGRKAA